MEELVKTRRMFCNYCENYTNHRLLWSRAYDHRSHEEDHAFYGEYRVWSCAGCDSCTLEDYYTSELFQSQNPDGEWQQDYDSICSPGAETGHRSTKQFHNMPEKLSKLYREVILAHNNGMHILCAAGLRGLIEGLCADRQISGRNLENKIDNMTAILPANIVQNLHSFRFIGNDAVHELEAPNEFTLCTAFDVIEDILNFLYALDYKANLLGKLKGPRNRTPNERGTTSP